jgi:hypothetical protein
MDSDIELAVVDSPNGNRVVLHIKAAYAEHVSLRMSERVKAALAEAKRRGVKLGHGQPPEFMRAMARLGHAQCTAIRRARDAAVAPIIWPLRAEGQTTAAIAGELNRRDIPMPRGGPWNRNSVLRILQRTADVFTAEAAVAAARPYRGAVRARERAQRAAPTAWRIRMTGRTFDQVADEMNRPGVLPLKHRPWSGQTVRSLLIRARKMKIVQGDDPLGLIKEKRRFENAAWAWNAAPVVWELLDAGLSLRKAARLLQQRGMPRRWADGGEHVLLRQPSA